MSCEVSDNIKQFRKGKGFSQETLASLVGVTKSTISQWELGKSYPKNPNLLRLAEVFEISIKTLENKHSELNKSGLKEDIQAIPFYTNVKAAAGNGNICLNEEYKYIHIKDLPLNANKKSLICISVVGDSMEPVLTEKSVLIVDKTKNQIIDGKIYVFVQDEQVRVKILSYNKHQIRVSSYNSYYPDEFYRFDEIYKLNIIGQVVHFSTKLD